MTDPTPRTLPTSAPPWTDEDAARDLEAVQHGHARAGYYRVEGEIVLEGTDGEIVRVGMGSVDTLWLGWRDARSLVKHPRDIWKVVYLGKTLEGSQI